MDRLNRQKNLPPRPKPADGGFAPPHLLNKGEQSLIANNLSNAMNMQGDEEETKEENS